MKLNLVITAASGWLQRLVRAHGVNSSLAPPQPAESINSVANEGYEKNGNLANVVNIAADAERLDERILCREPSLSISHAEKQRSEQQDNRRYD